MQTKQKSERKESSKEETLLSRFYEVSSAFFLFGGVNGGKAISSRPFNHVMTGSGPVLRCVCVSELWPH